MMDIYNRLRQDHETQRNLLAQIVDTSGDSPERQEIWEQLKVEAVAHANAEEQTFYSALIGEPKSQEQARHSVSEHKEASDLIEEISDMEMTNPHWLAKVKSLKHDLEHHMDEEEDEVFALAKKVLSDDLAHELVSRFEDRKSSELAENS